MKAEERNSRQWAEYYENLEQKNYIAYQESGESRYDRAQYKYGKIADAFRAQCREEDERGAIMRKRISNKDAVLDRLIPDHMYTAEEVKKLLEDKSIDKSKVERFLKGVKCSNVFVTDSFVRSLYSFDGGDFSVDMFDDGRIELKSRIGEKEFAFAGNDMCVCFRHLFEVIC